MSYAEYADRSTVSITSPAQGKSLVAKLLMLIFGIEESLEKDGVLNR